MTTGLAAIPLLALNLPAEAAGSTVAADPAPTGITVAWADAAHTKVRVTWHETGSLPNVINSQAAEPYSYYTPAGGPNQLDIPANELGGHPTVRIAVYAGTEAGGTTSPAGLSTEFDTLLAPAAVFDSIAPVAPDKFTVKWHPDKPVDDPNPGDKLDLPGAIPQYQVLANYGNFNQYDPVTPQSPATQATFKQLTAPAFRFYVRTYNEWGFAYSDVRRIDFEKIVGLSIPSAVDYGKPAIIRGGLERWQQACDPGPCWSMPWSDAQRTVVLQARTNASSPWYVVGSTRTDSNGAFSIAPPTLGTRQYRVVVPDLDNQIGFGFGVASGAVTTLAKPQVSGRFLDPTVKYGQKVTAHVSIAPPANVRSTLQRWDGKAWRDLKWVNLTKGVGNYTFTATQRGRYAYRFLIPAFTYAGRPLTWQVSANFVLTTS
jgi:hypothetical protein